MHHAFSWHLMYHLPHISETSGICVMAFQSDVNTHDATVSGDEDRCERVIIICTV